MAPNDSPHGDTTALVWSALRAFGQPPIDDDPPLHVFTLSVGVILGRMIERRPSAARDIKSVMDRICMEDSIEGIIKLCWGPKRSPHG